MRLPALILLIVGLAALAATAVQIVQLAAFARTAVHTTGTIVEASPHPRIRFTAGATPIEFTQNGFVSRPLGAEVPVAYNPAAPQSTAQAWTVWTTWITALWLLPMGIGFTLVALFRPSLIRWH